MTIGDSLYHGSLVELAPIDYEKDPEVMASWTHDARYTRLLDTEPVRPRSQAQIKKQLEQIEKESEDSQSLFYFAVRTLPQTENSPGQLIGFVRLFWIAWHRGGANIQLGIGRPEDWGKGYGQDTLRLALRFAFDELNLFRLTASIPEYNHRALRLFRGAGFVQETCHRQALMRDGQRWNLLTLGLLRDERLAISLS
jgi:RimJ/RimL family protein N-acetyltransferase